MRIALMLRAYDEKGGVGVYTQNIVGELLRRDPCNEYFLFYRDRRNIGRFAHYPNVTERLLRPVSTALWDQVAVPLACWRDGIDVLFNPKFTAPLLAPCKVVMVVHGADWFIPEQARFYRRLDVTYLKLFMPLYLRKCSAVISVSQLTTDNFNRIFDLPAGKVRTVYFGPARHFGPVGDPAERERVRARYGLPEHFILTLTKRWGGSRKNFRNLLQAYARYHARSPAPSKLVIGGEDCRALRQEYGIPISDYGRDVIFPGWLEQSDLPAIYSMADLYLYPSNLEAFPIPITEAMACGVPIVTSDANGLREIAGDAALLVDQEDPDAIAEAVARLVAEPDLRRTLRDRGLARAERFSWDRCAKETLAILTALGPGRSVAIEERT
jgi:glycosyltransferase involved in cell wall biosynthesis